MATQRKTLGNEVLDAVPDATPNFFSLDSTVQTDIPWVDPVQVPTPNRIIVRTIEAVAGANGPLAYLEPDEAHPYTGANAIPNMINRIIADDYDPQQQADAYERPLDLNLSLPTCFIFRLSDSWNWRFSHKVKGVTLGAGADGVNGFKQYYYNLLHVVPGKLHQRDPFPPDESCRLVYFIARPLPGVPQDPNIKFHHPFNLNIELVYDDDSNGDVNVIPIVIDPDVRHPGGSGE